MSAPDGMRPSDRMSSVVYAYWRLHEVYLSAIWAGCICLGPFLIYLWAQRQGYLPKSHAIRHVEGSVMFWLFVAAFVVVWYRFVRPDLVIRRRLEAAALWYGLNLQSRANGLAIDWIWASYANIATVPIQTFPFSMDITSATQVNDRCWALYSAADLSRLLVVTHTPKAMAAGLVTGRGSRTIEIVSVMYFGRSEADRAPLAPENRERLTALGFQIVQTSDGLWVNRTRANGRGPGQAAMDQVQTDQVVELWRLCSGVSA